MFLALKKDQILNLMAMGTVPLLLSPFCVFRLFRHDRSYVFCTYKNFRNRFRAYLAPNAFCHSWSMHRIVASIFVAKISDFSEMRNAFLFEKHFSFFHVCIKSS